MTLKSFKELWVKSIQMSNGGGVYCPEKDIFAVKMVDTADTNKTPEITPENCFKCETNVINGGICDPI